MIRSASVASKLTTKLFSGAQRVGCRNVSTTCSLISVPISLGQPFVGPDASPKVLKENGLLQLLGDCGWRVEQLPDIVAAGNVDTNKDPASTLKDVNAKNCAQVGATCHSVYEQVLKEAKTDNFVLILQLHFILL